MRLFCFLVLTLGFGCFSNAQWPGHAANPQHTARALVPSQDLQSIVWSTPIDLMPPYSGNDLLIHYGSPLITPLNTVILMLKTGSSDGFTVQARCGASGLLLWSFVDDYSLPPSGWIA